jgi:hypothetical protein
MKALAGLVLIAVLILFAGCLDSFLAIRRTRGAIPPVPILHRKEKIHENARGSDLDRD